MSVARSIGRRVNPGVDRTLALMGGAERLSAKRTSGGGSGEPGGSPDDLARGFVHIPTQPHWPKDSK
jgi:hypothetical protein